MDCDISREIYSSEEQRERDSKVLNLNGGTEYEPRLLSAVSKTLWVKNNP